jgi:hypothetical protein
MKQIISLLIFGSLFFFNNCSMAQQYGVVKTHAYVRNGIAGAVQADDNGVPKNSGVNREYLIFVETANTTVLPEWQMAFVNGSPFTVRSVDVSNNTLDLGTLKGGGKRVIIKKSPKNKIWQLMLRPTDAGIDAAKSPGTNPIILNGTWKKKNFTYKMSKLQELDPQFYQ